MKYAFSSNAFRKFSLEESIKVITSAGYEGIEIMADAPHAFPTNLTSADIRNIKAALKDSNLAISNINAFMHHADGDTYHPSWIENDPKLKRKRVNYTMLCLDLAAELGAANISTEPGGPLDGLTRADALEMYKEGLHAVADRAKQNGIRILIEPEPGLLIENSAQFLELMQDLDHEIFGVNFDIGHFYCVGENPADLVQPLSTYTDHFHLEDIAADRRHHHLMLGEGAIDIPGVLDTIVNTGYDGFITVELYTYEDDPINAVKQSFNYLNNRRR